jgi:uncharacterized membrane protein (UPF0127 family)
VTAVRQLIEAATGRVLLPQVEIADGFWSRLRGLQFRRALPAGTGVLLIPCSSVHTFFVRFRLDLLMLDGEMRVIGQRRNVAPWRLAFAPRGTHAVLETTAGECPPLALGVRVTLR